MEKQKEITDTLCEIIEVSAKLDDKGTKVILESFVEKLNKNEYFLPVIGQFSAGKSQLINKLLGQVILPVKSVETTAYITYIRYGENGAELVFKDGTIESISLNELVLLDQNESQNRTKEIESIYVSFTHPLLKNGLVLLDTPGVNTLINKHVSLTESVLDQSQYIIYVFGKSVTNEDLKMIERLKKIGINFLFVRTKLDEVKLDEETLEEALATDNRILTEIEGDDLVYFPVSNHPEIGESLEWFAHFSKLEEYLSQTIAVDTKTFYMTSLESRLTVIKENLRVKLDEKKQLLETTSKNSILEIEQKQKALEYEIRNLEREILVCEKNLSSKIPDLVASLKNDIRKQTQKELIKLEDLCNLDTCSIEKSGDYLQNNFNSNSEKVQNLMVELAEEKINGFTQNSISQFNDCFTELKSALSKEELSVTIDFDLNSYVEKSEQNSKLIDDFKAKQAQIEYLLQSNSAELEGIGESREQLQSTLERMNQTVEELNNSKVELDGSYEPQYKTEGGSKSGIFKAIGDVLDIGMLFIPASAFAKGATMLATKSAVLASKTSRFAKVGAKVLEGSSKALKIVAETDSLKDVVKVGETISRGLNSGKEMEPSNKKTQILSTVTNVLSMLSFAHWGEKLGSSIDPLKNVLDKEYEQQYLQSKNQLTSQINENKNKMLNEMEKLGLFENKEARVKKDQELMLKNHQVLEERLQKEKTKLQFEAEHRAKEQAKKLVFNKLKVDLSQFENELILKTTEILQELVNDMTMSATKLSIDKLETIKQSLTVVLADKKANVDSVETFQNEYEKLLAVL
ncbi:flagellar motor switch/type III secretory pathway protein FliN [Flavobacterium sp. 7E]|uniref:dynamin family protein n=1 Tax=Flavobacterium sp. 7E TaxID=2735898 RepID=UPI00156D8FA4|nr:dynamin family protein [Flavobacterium sp. 7E]NRS87749.1 flagellar motor switch/type III secretory pathway protein FliN [Flavobacterium sp. 7E]